MDDVPIERIKEFQAEWTDFLTTRRPELPQQILKQKALSPELSADLKTAADQFKGTWKK
jgi:F-type H+-transporting ATPase subunit alpha